MNPLQHNKMNIHIGAYKMEWKCRFDVVLFYIVHYLYDIEGIV